jgi:hypothetical protein
MPSMEPQHYILFEERETSNNYSSDDCTKSEGDLTGFCDHYKLCIALLLSKYF